MSDVNPDELRLLAAMAFGESSNLNNFEEMAGIASVLIRQRDARGYASMQDFVKKEPTYSYVVSDGNARYATLMQLEEAQVQKEALDAKSELKATQENIKRLSEKAPTETDTKKLKIMHVELANLKKMERSLRRKLHELDAHVMAFTAARHALEGGEDYSNGAYFWDGSDIKTNYKNHFKVKNGVKIIAPEHNIYGIPDSTKLVIIKKIVIKKSRDGKKTKTEEEKGRYDHVYESTAGHGGTIFWKQSKDYLDVTGAKAYK